MKRTKEEIINKIKELIKESVDVFGIKQLELQAALPVNEVKQLLQDNYMESMVCTIIEYTSHQDIKVAILKWLKQAYLNNKYEYMIRLVRCLDHLNALIWLDDPEFYKEIKQNFDKLTNKGLPLLNKISEKYNYNRGINDSSSNVQSSGKE